MAFFLLTALGLLALAAAFWIGRFLARKWKRLSRDRDMTQRRIITVDFYARFLKLMQRFGLPETPTMTPREFALQAEQRFSGKLAPSGLSGVATRLSEAFYSVRFGEATLTRDQLNEVERELTTLEACLSGGTAA